jgi:multidrug efflux pump subunit AcrB
MSNQNRGIIAWFAENSVAANLLMILVVLLGILEMGSLRKEAFPSREPDSITVSVSYDSGSAKQSEEGLAIKIEDQLENVIGIKTLTSTSTGSGVTITIEKQSDYDLDLLLKDVKTKIDAISTFPSDAKNPVIEKSVREEHAIWIQLFGNSDRHSLQYIANQLKTDLLGQDNISQVDISGWLDPMISIEIDEAQLQAYGLSLSDVEQAINNGSSNTMTAVIKNKQTYLQLKASEQAYLKEEFANIPLITTTSGLNITLGDITQITDTYDEDTSVLSRFQGQDSIALQVITTGQDDISDSVEDAKQVVDDWIARHKLPSGMQVSTWYDRSINIEQRLNLLIKNAITGIALVFILLALFLNLTVAFWVALGLPFVFFGTLYFMGDSYVGLSLNEFTTFGFLLALGIVVDDAVVVGESIYSERAKHGDSLSSTIKGTLKVAVPTLFGVFTTVAAFVALSQVSGGLGHLYSQFAAVVSIALILSVIESKLILPSHLSHLNTHKAEPTSKISRLWYKTQLFSNGLFDQFSNRIYHPVLSYVLRYRYAVVILFVTVLILVLSMPMTGLVRMSFFPSVPGDTVRAELTMNQDVSYGLTHQNLNHLEQTAYETDRQLRGETDSNVAIANLQVMSSSDREGKVTVELTSDAPYDINTFTQTWQQLTGIPEGTRTLSIQNARRMADALRIELRASDDEVLTQAGQMFKHALEMIPAVSGISDNLEPSQPQLHIALNSLGRSMGLTTDELASQVLQAFSGQVVQRFQRNSDEIEVKVRYPEESRQNPNDVLNAKIRTADGHVVSLSSVANITHGYTKESITRINAKRAVYISADVNKDALSSTELVSLVKREIVPTISAQFPSLDIHFAGEAEQQAETESSMVSMFIVALLVIYMLLAVPLKSYVQPFIIMTAIPFGVVGAVLGHWSNDLSLGILSLNGIIALSGVVVNDSLLLVARYNDLKSDMLSIQETLVTACSSRLRAVLLTSFTTFAGLVPLLGETSRQAQFLIPAAVSLGYGIMFATLITLLLVPALLLIQHDVQSALAKIKGHLTSSQGITDAHRFID